MYAVESLFISDLHIQTVYMSIIYTVYDYGYSVLCLQGETPDQAEPLIEST